MVFCRLLVLGFVQNSMQVQMVQLYSSFDTVTNGWNYLCLQRIVSPKNNYNKNIYTKIHICIIYPYVNNHTIFIGTMLTLHIVVSFFV